MDSDGPCDSCNQTRLGPSLLVQVSNSELTDEYACTSVSISLMHHHAPEMFCLAYLWQRVPVSVRHVAAVNCSKSDFQCKVVTIV